jgi:hypothetical protein
VGEYNIRPGHTSKVVLKFKLYDTLMSIVEINSKTRETLKEMTFHYNEYVDENGALLIGKYQGLLNEFVSRIPR